MTKSALCTLVISILLFVSGTSQALIHFDFEQPYFIEPGVLIKDHSLYRDGSVYHLFYLRGNSIDIGHATSLDLIHWNLEPPVLSVEPGKWDERALWAPQVMPFPAGGYIMYYTGVNNEWSQQTGFAISNDLYIWGKHPSPVYHPDSAWAEWTDSTWSHGRDPFVFEHEGTLYQLLTAKKKWNQGAIACATSNDYMDWQDIGPLYVHHNWHVLESVQLIVRNSKFHLFFTEEGVYGTSHMMSDSLFSGWDGTTSTKIDLGQAPEIDRFDNAYIFSRHDGFYDEHGITRYLLRFDTLQWEDDRPLVYQPWPLNKNWNLLYGNAFQSQPTFGNNPFCRGDSVEVGYQGHCWIGTYENYQGPLMSGSRGEAQGDSAWGLIRSKPFVITGNSMSLLVGGGDYPHSCFVALVEYGTFTKLFLETGNNSEVMTRRYWDLSEHKGKTVFIEIADYTMEPFGHINVDDIIESMVILNPPDNEEEKKSKDKLGLSAGNNAPPDRVELLGNAPNPFNPATTISYSLPGQRHIIIEVFDVNGAQIHELVNASQHEGIHQVMWSGQNSYGEAVSSGMYFYRLIADGKIIDTKKMILIK
jgi:hypothetical protein